VRRVVAMCENRPCLTRLAPSLSYGGRITGFDSRTGMHAVQYDDGSAARHDLTKKKVKVTHAPLPTPDQLLAEDLQQRHHHETRQPPPEKRRSGGSRKRQ
jgi:hypothetical protein